MLPWFPSSSGCPYFTTPMDETIQTVTQNSSVELFLCSSSDLLLRTVAVDKFNCNKSPNRKGASHLAEFVVYSVSSTKADKKAKTQKCFLIRFTIASSSGHRRCRQFSVDIKTLQDESGSFTANVIFNFSGNFPANVIFNFSGSFTANVIFNSSEIFI